MLVRDHENENIADNFRHFRKCLGYGLAKKYIGINTPILLDVKIKEIMLSGEFPSDMKRQDLINYAINLGINSIARELRISFVSPDIVNNQENDIYEKTLEGGLLD